MKRWFWIVVALVLATGTAAAAQTPGGQAGTPVVIGQAFTLPSSVLGQPRTLNVYVPPGYAEGSRRYPVLYLLDGGVEQDFHHISGLAQLASVNGATREVIVVGVETQDRRRELTFPAAQPRYRSEWPTHGDSAAFRRHLEQEIIPFVEARWRTSGERALMGESLAGLFVVETLLHQPALFDRYVAVSPSLWWDGGALVRQAPALLSRQDQEGGRTLWLASASEGPAAATLIRDLTEALKTRGGVRWTHSPRPEESHATVYHPAALEAFRALYALPPEPEGPCPWWLCPSEAADTKPR